LPLLAEAIDAQPKEKRKKKGVKRKKGSERMALELS
jgi:hypothetical protein